MEGDAAARADLLRAKVVDRHGAAHVAVEGERDVVLKWEKVMLEIPRHTSCRSLKKDSEHANMKSLPLSWSI